VIPNLTSGTVLARSYRLLHPIGEGGMGRVWVAEHIALDRRVAVKVMSEEAIATPMARELFDREARATAKVVSPHVVRVLDFDVTDDGFPFLVLELLTGETLEDRIVRDGPLSLGSAELVLKQVTHALAEAHACGILHRDIKAENIFLVGDDRTRIDVRLLDFGVALTKNTKALIQGPVGTLCYMSPEQIVAGEIDERSDLFSLAICVYYALTGRFPFDGSTLAEVGASLTRMCQPVTALRSDLPASLDTWFSRALARDPRARFSSATEMCDAFERPLHRHTPMTHETDVDVGDLVAAGVPRHHLGRWALAMVAAAAVVVGATHAREIEQRIAFAQAALTTDPDDELATLDRTPTALQLPQLGTAAALPSQFQATTRVASVAVVAHASTSAHGVKVAALAASAASSAPRPVATAAPTATGDPNDIPTFGGRE
jgi:serine/threonine-protein kinase